MTAIAAAELRRHARAWLEGLTVEQSARARFPFASDERFVWQYTPGPRSGLAIGDMTAGQRASARSLVGAAMSRYGAAAADAIIALEPILAEIERDADDPMWRERDPERYWFSVFGDPDADHGAPWGWRVSGHHLLVQATVLGDQVAFTPSFLGANPAVVPGGPHAGSRALAGEEGLARALLASLSVEQRAIAVVDPVAPWDLRSGDGDGRPSTVSRSASAARY